MDAGFERVDRDLKAGFERVDHDIRDLRSEAQGQFAETQRHFAETQRQFSETQRQFSELYRTIIRFNVAMLSCVFGTVLALVGTLVANSMGTT
jgi:hypothetical protein